MIGKQALTVFHSVVVTALIFLYLLADYEQSVVQRISQSTTVSEMSDKEVVVALLNKTHTVLSQRSSFYQKAFSPSWLEQFFPSTEQQLVDPFLACGAYTSLLVRLLQENAIPVRIVQLKCKAYGVCHILVEARLGDKWVVLDPLYNLVFKNPENKLASFTEIQADWEYYSKQVPENYNPDYNFYDRQYTNWNKVPVLMPMFRSLLKLVLDEERVSQISLRVYFLSAYKSYFYGLLVLYLLVCMLFCVSLSMLLVLRQKD